jgi:GGDEF domain-containing protein
MIGSEPRLLLLALAIVLLLVAVFAMYQLMRRRAADRAIRDFNTGAYTPDFIEEVYQAELRRAERTGVPFSVALVAIRDEDLAAAKSLPPDLPTVMVRWLRSNLRSSDYIGRLDTYRFALVLPETWEEDARIVVGRIDGSFRYESKGSTKERWLTCSVGVATWSPENTDAWASAEQQLMDALRRPKAKSTSTLSPHHT